MGVHFLGRAGDFHLYEVNGHVVKVPVAAKNYTPREESRAQKEQIGQYGRPEGIPERAYQPPAPTTSDEANARLNRIAERQAAKGKPLKGIPEERWWLAAEHGRIVGDDSLQYPAPAPGGPLRIVPAPPAPDPQPFQPPRKNGLGTPDLPAAAIDDDEGGILNALLARKPQLI